LRPSLEGHQPPSTSISIYRLALSLGAEDFPFEDAPSCSSPTLWHPSHCVAWAAHWLSTAALSFHRYRQSIDRDQYIQPHMAPHPIPCTPSHPTYNPRCLSHPFSLLRQRNSILSGRRGECIRLAIFLGHIELNFGPDVRRTRLSRSRCCTARQ
jgi:hypothetical protein